MKIGLGLTYPDNMQFRLARREKALKVCSQLNKLSSKIVHI